MLDAVMTASQLSLGMALDPARTDLGPGAVVLHGFARPRAEEVLAAIASVAEVAPFRHMTTPGGTMSVAMTNCGALGWTSSAAGYAYLPTDPETGARWPPMPDALRALAVDAARAAGFDDFRPDACLVNRYVPGARMGLHQDRDERDLGAPIVSVSLGIDAVFLFGGPTRAERPRRVPLVHGDVVVWGGPTRLHYHGVAPLKEAEHPALGAHRINLTFRKAGERNGE